MTAKATAKKTAKKTPRRKSIRESLGLNKTKGIETVLEEVGDKLSVAQEVFCQLITDEGELFNNATMSYAEAYKYDLDAYDHEDAIIQEEIREPETRKVIQEYKVLVKSSYDRARLVCSVNAARLLRKAKIRTRIQELIHEKILDEKVVDARMAHWIMNDAEPATSARMIEQFNKLRKRINDEPAKTEIYIGLDDVIKKAHEAYMRTHGNPSTA